MKIISFAWTTAALVAGRKTVTRRAWKKPYARRFRPGELVQAYSRNPQFGGEQVAIIRLKSIEFEPNACMPDSDWEAEGFRFFYENPQHLPQYDPFNDRDIVSWEGFNEWRDDEDALWVIRFELVEVTKGLDSEY